MKRKEIIIKELDKEITLVIKQPAFEDIEQADKIYATKIASMIRENANKRLLLRSQVDEYLRSVGVWNDADEQKVEKLRKEIEQLLDTLRRGGIKLKEGREHCIAIMEKRKEIVTITAKKQVFDDITVESVAENEKIDYLIYACTVYADSGKNYWMSFEDMKNDKLSNAYRQASFAVLEVVYNIDANFEKNLPENKWLKKFNFIDDDLNYVDRKTGEKVDRNGIPVKVLEEELKRKIENLNGDLKEETPFIDDETGEPVIIT